METWMNQTWWLYDLTVIAIVTLCIWGGWRRGLIRTAAGLLGYGAALLLSAKWYCSIFCSRIAAHGSASQRL